MMQQQYKDQIKKLQLQQQMQMISQQPQKQAG